MAAKIEKPIKNFLIDFGLTDKEITVYLCLLKTGPNTIMNLARETGIKRSTTHNTVEELIKKGLVSQTNYGERRMVVAEDPKKLEFLMEQKRWDMKKLEDNMPDIIKAIYDNVPKAKDNTKVSVRYYEGREGTIHIYKEAFSAKELRSYVNLEATSKAFPENSEMFVDSQKRNKELKVWEIVERSPETIAQAEKYKGLANFEYKTTDKLQNLTSINTLIFDGKVAVVNFKENITGIIIESPDYYFTSKAIFEMLWDAL